MNSSGLIKLKIVGIFTNEYYQECKLYASLLHLHLPHIYDIPVFRPMLDVQWNEFLTKNKRDFGGKFWHVSEPIVVYFDEIYTFNEKEFVSFCNVKYNFNLKNNFTLKTVLDLKNFINRNERPLVYFLITIDNIIAGTLLFQLYTDLVPLTCANFLRLILKENNGYTNAPIQRICKSSWVQLGGYFIKHHKMSCENYYVSHDKRGVLSMCNDGKHKKNSSQFFVSLNNTPWMDYHYVAFGQLLHGDEVLKKIEIVQLNYESPICPITIQECGIYTVDMKPNKEYLDQYNEYIRNINLTDSNKDSNESSINDTDDNSVINYLPDIQDVRDVSSNLSLGKYKRGFYSLDGDFKNKNKKNKK